VQPILLPAGVLAVTLAPGMHANPPAALAAASSSLGLAYLFPSLVYSYFHSSLSPSWKLIGNSNI